jgi:hypothetical protein
VHENYETCNFFLYFFFNFSDKMYTKNETQHDPIFFFEG